MDSAVLALFSDGVASHDPTYAQDFWTAPGYLGTEQSELGDLIREQAVNHTARINSIERAGNQNIRLLLDSAPPTQPGLHFELHNDQGESFGALVGTLDGTTFTVEATTTVVAEPSDGNDGGTNLSGGEIAGIVIGSIVGVLLLFWIVRSCGMWGQPGLWGREPSPPPRRRHRGRSSHGHYRHQSTASRRRSPSHGRTSYEVRYSPNVMREKSRSPRRPDVVYDHRRGSRGRSRNYDYDY
ncbi:hypothetical protein HYQ44_020201 [Verticillium longisporum]|nr:hypothetical protein HYQ44_020201 [Verticillium longisporum]